MPTPGKVDKSHFRECLLEMLSDMFGANAVDPLIRNEKLYLSVDEKKISVDLSTLVSRC